MGNILRIKNVSKSFSFGKVEAVKGIELSIRRNTVTAIIGPNGAGKSTLFNLISGYVRPDAGEIVYLPRKGGTRPVPLAGLPPWKIARLGVGRLFQDMHVFERMSVLDNMLAGFRHRSNESLLRSVFRREAVRREEARNLRRALGLLETVGLLDEADRPAAQLSYGQQKLLSVARLLANDPELLLLDEPTAGLSVAMVERMRDLIVRLVRGMHLGPSERRTVIIIEHNLSFIDKIADYCCVMRAGEVDYFGAGGVRWAFRQHGRGEGRTPLGRAGAEGRPGRSA